ncbi:uroporphyrinogen-III synthase [Commensalibacter communis]|uniref:uroporphyrinogen-III synthase n=1 Tax=Commensalibacter communis TaxID=2972786 RepID=UPI0022FFA9E3|nr:uroporphyrinogen-III synthase [Commensalibacter communis]CAI3947244.1 Uroporphyrinogen-III synthase (HemD) (PDB:1JR2) [Commensalibacter communis]CAI3947453.1 Uroporphyrinogen-III synthase (HemD) (PDB:1JR2) [Commensalibacter communis]
MSRKNKPYLVITRPEPGLSETALKVTQLGWQPLLMPVMTIVSLPFEYSDMDGLQAIIFTSRQAIIPTIQQFIKQHIAFQHIPVFTVGDITAQDAKQAGFVHVISAGKDAVALAELITRQLSPDKGNLFFPSALGQGQLLVELVEQSGFNIIQRAAYKTESILKLPDEFIAQLRAEAINSILFFSSETARFFVELVPTELQPDFQSIQAIGISPKTRKYLKHISWRSIEIAAHPNTEEMLCLLKEHF